MIISFFSLILFSPFFFAGNLVFVSGQIPKKDGALIHCGIVGDDVSIENAQEAARVVFILFCFCFVFLPHVSFVYSGQETQKENELTFFSFFLSAPSMVSTKLKLPLAT